MKSQLERFSESFKTEADLRKHVYTLLTKMPNHQGVQITHGAQELGKDIVFYSPSGFDHWVLNACVIKNDKISGSVADNDGARTVLFQVEQALDSPFVNSSGEEENVSHVYIISPHDCSQITINSIKGKLNKGRSGQITFLCGSLLLEKFARFWEEFLLFDSSLLGAYVAAMQKGFDQYDPLSALLLHNPILAADTKKLTQVYVRQRFKKIFEELELTVDLPVAESLLSPLREADVVEFSEAVSFAAGFLSHSQIWEDGDEQRATEFSVALKAFASPLRKSWTTEWENRRLEAQRLSQNYDPKTIARITLPRHHYECAVPLLATAASTISAFAQHVTKANKFARQKGTSISTHLHAAEHLTYCRVHEVLRLAPAAFRKVTPGRSVFLPETLLDKTVDPLLITAPPGHGKTSFCKWNAISDAHNLANDDGAPLPVYVALHQIVNVGSVRETFFANDEISELVESAEKNKRKIRLYLDGLDEVSSSEKQRQLMTLASRIPAEHPNVQIVITGRDYVSGPWLRWVPRVSIAELDDSQVAALASKWLDDSTELETFEQQLASNVGLQPLMRIPLLGTLIIAVFRKMRSLPENRIKLYEIFVDLMCGGWDLAKNVKRPSQFAPTTKMAVLTRLAGILHVNSRREAQESDIRTAVQHIARRDLERWRFLLNEILEDGLLVKAGSNMAFSHLSFQEFLAARDLSDPTGSRQQHALRDFLQGEDWWREVLSFYVATSTRPDEMESWIIKTARNVGAEPTYVGERVSFLLSRIVETAPGWTPTQKLYPGTPYRTFARDGTTRIVEFYKEPNGHAN